MKFLLLCLLLGLATTCIAQPGKKTAQEEVKKDTTKATLHVPSKASRTKTAPPASSDASIYTLTSAKLSIKTGNDNKEYPSKFLFYVMENKGIWGEGSELFTQQDQPASVKELTVNSEAEIPLRMPVSINAGAYTLENLQNKGLRFIIYYLPNFFADAWKIESVKLTLEFKDQYGRLHPTMANKTIQYNITNGLLTNTNKVMSGSTDVFLTPQPVTITAQ